MFTRSSSASRAASLNICHHCPRTSASPGVAFAHPAGGASRYAVGVGVCGRTYFGPMAQEVADNATAAAARAAIRRRFTLLLIAKSLYRGEECGRAGRVGPEEHSDQRREEKRHHDGHHTDVGGPLREIRNRERRRHPEQDADNAAGERKRDRLPEKLRKDVPPLRADGEP